MISSKRIQKDIIDLEKNPIEHISAGPKSYNIYEWEGTLMGPSRSPYAGGVFNLSIIFPSNYPFKPPKVKFLTKIFHPNIDYFGNICLDLLNVKWCPSLNISKLLLSILSLLDDPNPDDPLNKDAAKIYLEDNDKYIRKARIYTIQYASPK